MTHLLTDEEIKNEAAAFYTFECDKLYSNEQREYLLSGSRANSLIYAIVESLKPRPEYSSDAAVNLFIAQAMYMLREKEQHHFDLVYFWSNRIKLCTERYNEHRLSCLRMSREKVTE